MSTLAKRIQGVRRGTKFIEWNEAAVFADELDQIRTSIIEDLAPKAPRSAGDLLADFVHASDRVYGRADGCRGSVGCRAGVAGFRGQRPPSRRRQSGRET